MLDQQHKIIILNAFNNKFDELKNKIEKLEGDTVSKEEVLQMIENSKLKLRSL